MKEWLTVLATLLGRLGTLGVVLLLFSAGAIYAEGRGAPMPTLIVEWSRAGAILGLVLTVVAGLSKLGNLLRQFAERMSEKRSVQAEITESGREALENLATLQNDEAEFLCGMLNSSNRRFHVGMVTPAPGLMSKKILVWKSNVSALEWICELHPEIEKRRERIAGLLEKSIRERGGF